MIRSYKRGVMIIEDDDEIRNSFVSTVNSSDDYKVVGDYPSCELAIANLKKVKPEIVLMDIKLPGMSGIEGVHAIKEINHLIEVIMVTIFEDSELVFEALKMGASGYITKSSNDIELLEALNEITSGGAPMTGKIARMVIRNFHISHTSPLTRREKEILQLLAEGMTYLQISEKLFISLETTKSHIRNIYPKLQVNSKNEAVAKATKERFI